MPTLREYEARGIDITLMPHEQLAAEGYITPMNELATVIDGPGEYVMRSGRRVTIHEVKPASHSSATEFNAKGSVWRHKDWMGSNPEYQTWHISGRVTTFRELSYDIVAKWEDPK